MDKGSMNLSDFSYFGFLGPFCGSLPKIGIQLYCLILGNYFMLDLHM